MNLDEKIREDFPWYEDGNCVICGFSHRYQWPSGSDADGHDGSYVACINMLRPELTLEKQRGEAYRAALEPFTDLAVASTTGKVDAEWWSNAVRAAREALRISQGEET